MVSAVKRVSVRLIVVSTSARPSGSDARMFSNPSPASALIYRLNSMSREVKTASLVRYSTPSCCTKSYSFIVSMEVSVPIVFFR